MNTQESLAVDILCRLTSDAWKACTKIVVGSSHWWPTTIDPGWATIVSAIVGFGALVFQTHIGFRNLQRSNETQSNADRLAREHQATLQRALDIELEARAARTLAAALAAELLQHRYHMLAALKLIKVYCEGYEKMSEYCPKLKSISDLLPIFQSPIFNSNAGNIGILGNLMASEVVDIYTTIHYRANGSADLLTGSQIASVLKNYEKGFEEWVLDAHHLKKRLLAFCNSEAEIESLSDFRLRRIAAAANE